MAEVYTKDALVRKCMKCGHDPMFSGFTGMLSSIPNYARWTSPNSYDKWGDRHQGEQVAVVCRGCGYEVLYEVQHRGGEGDDYPQREPSIVST